MWKLIGAVLVIFAGTMIGFHQAAQLSARPRQIRQLIHALQQLETEIMYGLTPLPDALQRIGRQIAEPLAGFFAKAAAKLSDHSGTTATESWQQAIREEWKRTAMRRGEREAMVRLGYTLGISDREDQMKHIRLAASVLHEEEQAAAEDQKRYEKMWKSLGLLAGMLLAILMY